MTDLSTPPEALPRDPLTDANQMITRGWRNYFENRTRRLGEVISGLGWGATAAEAAASNALVSAGVNVCLDTRFRGGTTAWNTYSTIGTVAFSAAEASGIRYGQLQVTSWNPASGAYAYLAGFPQRGLAVQAGERVEGRVLIGGTSGLTGQIWIAWINAAGTWFDTSSLEFVTLSLAGGGARSTYHEIGGFATAPTNTAFAVLYAQFLGGSSGTVNIRVAAPFISRARTDQTAVTPIQILNDYLPGADPTLTNTAAGITGQGNLATANNARGTTAARPAAANTWSFYANTTTNTLQIDVPTTGWVDVATLSTAVQTRGKILGPAAVSFSANNTWQEVAQVDVSDVPSGGVIQVPYVDVVGQSQSGPVIGSGYSWRLTEALVSSPSSKTVIKSGAITITAGAGTDPPTVDDVVQPTAALVTVTNTGSVRYIIEVQRTSGTATIGLQLTANFIVGPS